ncbi:hypothetical protein ACQEU3_33495 [Spirillospora sp. CA-253888]
MAYPEFLSTRRKGVVTMLWTGPLALASAAVLVLCAAGLINVAAYHAGTAKQVTVRVERGYCAHCGAKGGEVFGRGVYRDGGRARTLEMRDVRAGQTVTGRLAPMPWAFGADFYAEGRSTARDVYQNLIPLVIFLLFGGAMLGMFLTASRAARGLSMVRAHPNSTFHVDDV